MPFAVFVTCQKHSAVLKSSGKSFYFPKGNPLNIKDLQVDFSEENYVIARSSSYAGVQDVLKIPLNGSYLKDTSWESRNDTQFLRGYWQDDDTFVVEVEQTDKEMMYFTFADGRVTIKLEDRGKTVFNELIGLEESLPNK